MTHVAARRGKGLRQMRWLDAARCLEEDRRQQQALHKSQAVRGEGFRCQHVEVARHSLHREHGTLAKEGFNAHRQQI